MEKNKWTATLKVVARVERVNDELFESNNDVSVQIDEIPKEDTAATLLSALESMANDVRVYLAEKAGVNISLEQMFAAIIAHKNIMDMRKRGQAIYEKNICN